MSHRERKKTTYTWRKPVIIKEKKLDKRGKS